MKKYLLLTMLLLPVTLWAKKAVFPKDWVGHTFANVIINQNYHDAYHHVEKMAILSPTKVRITVYHYYPVAKQKEPYVVSATYNAAYENKFIRLKRKYREPIAVWFYENLNGEPIEPDYLYICRLSDRIFGFDYCYNENIISQPKNDWEGRNWDAEVQTIQKEKKSRMESEFYIPNFGVFKKDLQSNFSNFRYYDNISDHQDFLINNAYESHAYLPTSHELDSEEYPIKGFPKLNGCELCNGKGTRWSFANGKAISKNGLERDYVCFDGLLGINSQGCHIDESYLHIGDGIFLNFYAADLIFDLATSIYGGIYWLCSVPD